MIGVKERYCYLWCMEIQEDVGGQVLWESEVNF